jgi:hypothetical protein
MQKRSPAKLHAVTRRSSSLACQPNHDLRDIDHRADQG